MPPLPESRERNVVASLFTYIKSNFTTVPMDYAGSGLKEEDADMWGRADVMFPKGKYGRQVSSSTMGEDSLAMLNVNFMQKQSVYEKNPYVLIDLIDGFKDLFRVPLGIPIMDHAGTPANRIGTLQTFELETAPLLFNEVNAIYIRNVTSTMRYVSEWNPPS